MEGGLEYMGGTSAADPPFKLLVYESAGNILFPSISYLFYLLFNLNIFQLLIIHFKN